MQLTTCTVVDFYSFLIPSKKTLNVSENNYWGIILTLNFR